MRLKCERLSGDRGLASSRLDESWEKDDGAEDGERVRKRRRWMERWWERARSMEERSDEQAMQAWRVASKKSRRRVLSLRWKWPSLEELVPADLRRDSWLGSRRKSGIRWLS